MPKKLTIDEAREEFKKAGYELLEDSYINVETPMRFKCYKHPDKELKLRLADLKRGSRCKYCNWERIGEERRKTYEEVFELFESRGYELLDTVYKGNHIPLRFKCPHHPDKENKATYSDMRRGVSCPYCVGLGKPSIEEVKAEFDRRGYVLLEKEYKNSRTKMKYRCKTHPELTLYITYGNFKHKEQGCYKCAGRDRYDIEKAREIFEDNGYRLLETKYKNNDTPMRFICKYHPEKETKISLKSLLEGVKCRFCSLEKLRGENHPSYNPNLTEEERKVKRFYPEYYEWRRIVFERDDFTCRKCGDDKGGNLRAHHINSYDWCEEGRTDPNNGITLCDECHKNFHNDYGYGENTKEQFEEWFLKAQ